MSFSERPHHVIFFCCFILSLTLITEFSNRIFEDKRKQFVIENKKFFGQFFKIPFPVNDDFDDISVHFLKPL